MIVEYGLQTLSTWGTHVPSDGSQIGGVDPVRYGFVQGLPASPTAALFSISGSTVAGGYASFEAYQTGTVLPNSGILQMDFDIITDVNAPGAAQAIETDTILVVNGYKYNFSLQNNYAEGGRLQIFSASTNGWVDIPGANPGILAPGTAFHYRIFSSFSTTAKNFSMVSVGVGSTLYTVPATLQNQPAEATTWTNGVAFFQVQLDLNAKAGAYSITLDNINRTWR